MMDYLQTFFVKQNFPKKTLGCIYEIGLILGQIFNFPLICNQDNAKIAP